MTEHPPLSTDPEFFRQMLEASPSAIILTDIRQPDMPVVYVNTAFERLTGYPRDEVIGRNPRFLQNDDRDQDVLTIFREALRDEATATVTLRNYRKDGTLFWNEMRIAPLRDRDGAVTHYIGVQHDVTERKHTQDTMHESEARYRTIMEHFPNGLVALYDHDLRYLVVGGQGLAEVGLTIDDLRGKRLRDVFPPEVYERDEPALIAALRGEHTDNIVKHLGRHFRVMTTPVHDDDDKVIAGMVMTQDITAQKQAEESLRQREEEFRALVENSPDFVVRLDRESHHLYANPAFASALGHRVEEVIGKTNEELGIAESKRHYFDSIRRWVYETGEEHTTEFDYPTVEGNRHFHLRLIPEYDEQGNVSTILSLTRDITGRKHIENAMQEAQERYKLLADLAIEGIVIHTEGYVRDANRAFLAMFGYEMSDLAGRQAVDMLFTPESRAIVYENIARRHDQPYEVTCVRRDGTTFPAEIEARQLNGDIRVASVRDITERKRAQQRELEITLERERVRILTDFMQSASHEFKTPLATISTGAYLMASSDDAERRAQKAEQTQQQVRRLSGLIDMLLMMTYLEGMPFVPEKMNINGVVRDFCNDFQDRHAQPAIQCIIDTEIPTITGDDEWLREALNALVDNARRFGPLEGTITVRTSYVDSQVVIAVQDEGPGIPADSQAHIFNTFWRDDKSHSTPGFGLGLSLARKVAMLHGGELVLHHTGDDGSTFHMRLPVQ